MPRLSAPRLRTTPTFGTILTRRLTTVFGSVPFGALGNSVLSCVKVEKNELVDRLFRFFREQITSEVSGDPRRAAFTQPFSALV